MRANFIQRKNYTQNEEGREGMKRREKVREKNP